MVRLKERGDTIVEVLIAVAIVSLVVGGAYGVTTRNLANTRQAQEHSEASKLAQQQIEQLRVLALSATSAQPPFSYVGQSYCIDSTTGQPSTTFARPAISAPDSDYASVCRNLGSSNYRVYIIESSQVFQVNVSWVGPSGKQQQLNLYYKAFPNEG